MANNIYYLINVGRTNYGVLYGLIDRLFYHKIDMNANTGAGKVIQRMQVLDAENYGAGTLRSFSPVGLTACRHANGKDWWVLKSGDNQLNYFTYLFTQDSVIKKGEQVFSIPFDGGGAPSEGQAMFNDAGTQLLYLNNEYRGLAVLDFDRCTGILSNPKYFNQHYIVNDTDYRITGGCFSPNGRFVYIGGNFHVMQLDLQATDSATQWFTIAGRDTSIAEFKSYSNLYPGPDGKVYIGSWLAGRQFSVINQPDSPRVACQFCPRCLRMDSVIYYYASSPPNMPNYNLGASSVPCYPEGTSQLGISNYNIKVFPNPSNGIINVEYKFDKTAEFNVYNLVGQLLYTTTLPVERDKKQLNLFNLKTGIYTYQILQNGKVVKTGKLTLVN